MNAKTKSVESEAVDSNVAAVKAIADPLKSALEQVINDAEIGNVIAMYDTGHEDFKADVICEDAAQFVLKGLIGALCYNVVDGFKGNGQTMLNNALDQVDQAAERDATFQTEKSADQLAQRIAWAARMDVQQAYRESLQKFVTGLYTAVTGERYQARAAVSIGKPESTEQSVADKLRARRRAV